MRKHVRTALAVALLVSGNVAYSEPLDQFQEIVARCKAVHEVQHSEVSLLRDPPRWLKRVVWPADAVGYDVKRTDSLVSPYAAFLSFTALESRGVAATEDAAKVIELKKDEATTRITNRLNFSYQSGKWVVVDGIYSVSMRIPKHDFPAPRSGRVPKETIVTPGSPIERCLRE